MFDDEKAVKSQMKMEICTAPLTQREWFTMQMLKQMILILCDQDGLQLSRELKETE